jgi:hypothetical protein
VDVRDVEFRKLRCERRKFCGFHVLSIFGGSEVVSVGDRCEITFLGRSLRCNSLWSALVFPDATYMGVMMVSWF